MSNSTYDALLAVVMLKRDELLNAETALRSHCDDLVRQDSPFQIGDVIADRRVQTKPFAVVENVYCNNPDLTVGELERRIIIRKIRNDGEPSLNVQQLRNPSLYIKFKTATPTEDDEL